jgi:hypothetical protein
MKMKDEMEKIRLEAGNIDVWLQNYKIIKLKGIEEKPFSIQVIESKTEDK